MDPADIPKSRASRFQPKKRTDAIEGISRTVNYRGNRIDIGGHRFFSKSARVMDWWLNILPLQSGRVADCGNAILDGTVIRMPYTYPAYFRTYDRFDVVRDYTDTLENLFLIGRNGMHRYNNQDHSMLTAMAAVENLRDGRTSKANLWAVNAERERQARPAVEADGASFVSRPGTWRRGTRRWSGTG